MIPQHTLSYTESPQVPCWHKCHQLLAYTQDLPSLADVGVPLSAPQHQGSCQICPHKPPSESQPLAAHAEFITPFPGPFTLPACPAQVSHCFMPLFSVCHSSALYCIISVHSTVWLVHCLKCVRHPSYALVEDWDFGLHFFRTFLVLGHLANAAPKVFIPD